MSINQKRYLFSTSVQTSVLSSTQVRNSLTKARLFFINLTEKYKSHLVHFMLESMNLLSEKKIMSNSDPEFLDQEGYTLQKNLT